MTPEQRVRLQAAVREVNAAIADIYLTDASAIKITPRCSYSHIDGYAMIAVEVTTGVDLIE